MNERVAAGEGAVLQAVHATTSLIQLDRLLERFGQALVRELTSIARTDGGAAASGVGTTDACGTPSVPAVGRLSGWEHDDAPAVAYSGRSDLMVACYPADPSAEVRGYRAHLDNPGPVGETTEATSAANGVGASTPQHGRTGSRLLTMVTYLNTEWDERAGGGELRLFLPDDVAAAEGCVPAGMAGHVDVAPRADTVVIFRSDLVLHEVRPANQRRLAATLWLHASRGGAAETEEESTSFWT